jgi:peptidoglycan/LPS O-acetylase OafA/YrhL
VAAFLFIHFRGRFSPVWKYALALASAACLGLSFVYGSFGTGYFNVCWQFTLTGVGSSALILSLVSVGAGKFLPLKKAFSAISKYSYTMYLYHLLFLTMTHNYLRALLAQLGTGTAGFLLVFALYFAVVTASSMAIYAVIDRPFMNWRKRLLRKKEKEAEEAAVGAGV